MNLGFMLLSELTSQFLDSRIYCTFRHLLTQETVAVFTLQVGNLLFCLLNALLVSVG